MFISAKITISNIPLSNYYAEYYSIKGGDTYLRYSEFDASDNFDVLVFGSSHAYRSYDPRIFKKNKLKMYNLGSSGQSMNDTYMVISEILSMNKPRYIIVDLTPGAFESDGIESSSKLITNLNSVQFKRKILFNNLDWRMVNVYVSGLFNDTPPKPFKASINNGKYINGGYVEIQKKCSKKYNYKSIGKSYEPNEKNEEAFHSLINFLSENKIKTYFVLHPIPLGTNRTENSRFIEYIQKSIKGRNEITLIDFSFRHHLNKTENFYDHHHLNQSGTNFFNEKLISELEYSN
jgi:hypothetical protein